MKWSFDEGLLYVGIIIAALALVLLIVLILLAKIKEMKIIQKLTSEYGEPRFSTMKRKHYE